MIHKFYIKGEGIINTNLNFGFERACWKASSILLAVTIIFHCVMPALSQAASTTLMCWNIQVGSDSGVFQNNWPKRKEALKSLLLSRPADILCLQEVVQPQLKFLEGVLPSYGHVGVARDDGQKKGEYSPIFFNRTKFKAVRSGTFWLSDRPDSYEATWDFGYKRICTWAKFRSIDNAIEFFVFNTHFPLNPLAQSKSAALVLHQIDSLAPNSERILCGDFNSQPESAAWNCFRAAGLSHVESDPKEGRFSKTYHVLGNPTMCIDGIFVSRGITVQSHRIIDKMVDGTYPSDHFGTVVNLKIRSQQKLGIRR